MQRIYIVGSSGAGKSTLAEKLAETLGLEHTELDAVHWQADWTELGKDVFRQRVSELVASERWIIDGNYRAVQDIILTRIDTLIWLDYSLARLYRQLVPRTLKRIFGSESLWNGNRETFRSQFLSRNSLLLYVYKVHKDQREHYRQLSTQTNSFAALHFRTPQELKKWLESV